MRLNKTVYVAETDENGAIQCVWLDTFGQKSVRPFNPKRHRFDMDARAEFSGAKPAAIASWLAFQQHQEERRRTLQVSVENSR